MIVPQLVTLASSLIGAGAAERYFENDAQERVQKFFDKNPTFMGSAANAKACVELVNCILDTNENSEIRLPNASGFCRIGQVFMHNSNPYVCISLKQGYTYGINANSNGNLQYAYWVGGCRLANDDEAKAFINNTVSKWTDAQIMTCLANMGSPYLPELLEAIAPEEHC